MTFQDDQKINSIHRATNLRNSLKNIYQSARSVQELLALYASGTDATFNAVIDALYNQQEKAHLAQMLEALNLLVTDWETSHAAAIGLSSD